MRYLTLLALFALQACSSAIGLVPIQPKHGKTIEGTTLLLEWEPSQEPADDIVYQLVIQNSDGVTVYELPELAATRHVVEDPLGPGRYRWSVRALHLRNGKWVPGEWNLREYAYFFVFFVSAGKGPYEFRLKNAINVDANGNPVKPQEISLWTLAQHSTVPWPAMPAAR